METLTVKSLWTADVSYMCRQLEASDTLMKCSVSQRALSKSNHITAVTLQCAVSKQKVSKWAEESKALM